MPLHRPSFAVPTMRPSMLKRTQQGNHRMLELEEEEQGIGGPIVKRQGFRASVSERDDTEHIEGFLYKQTNSRFQLWQKRWFTCKNHYLTYSSRKGDTKVQASIDLSFVSHVIYMRGVEFMMHGPDPELASYRLKAEDASMASRWVRVITQHIRVPEEGDLDDDDNSESESEGNGEEGDVARRQASIEPAVAAPRRGRRGGGLPGLTVGLPGGLPSAVGGGGGGDDEEEDGDEAKDVFGSLNGPSNTAKGHTRTSSGGARGSIVSPLRSAVAGGQGKARRRQGVKKTVGFARRPSNFSETPRAQVFMGRGGERWALWVEWEWCDLREEQGQEEGEEGEQEEERREFAGVLCTWCVCVCACVNGGRAERERLVW